MGVAVAARGKLLGDGNGAESMCGEQRGMAGALALAAAVEHGGGDSSSGGASGRMTLGCSTLG